MDLLEVIVPTKRQQELPTYTTSPTSIQSVMYNEVKLLLDTDENKICISRGRNKQVSKYGSNVAMQPKLVKVSFEWSFWSPSWKA